MAATRTERRPQYESIRYGELPDTATYTDRGWTFLPLDDEPPADGLLKIGQRKGRTFTRDEYLIAEQPPEAGIAGKIFLLAKQSGERADVYQTIIGPMCWCQCTAGRVRHVMECKHVTAIKAMIADGVF